MRVKIDSRASNSAGSCTTGSALGRNPRVVETMKAGREVSSGLVEWRMGKLGGMKTVILKQLVEKSVIQSDLSAYSSKFEKICKTGEIGTVNFGAS